jgi:hypothetical protein
MGLPAPRPTTAKAKLEWIERHGAPTYLDPAPDVSTLPDGREMEAHPPRDRGAYQKEIQAVYHVVFEQADTQKGREAVLKSYSANFPHLAFDPDSWLWEIWQVARVVQGEKTKSGEASEAAKVARSRLRALATGIQAPGQGWMSKPRWKASLLQLAQARRSAWPQVGRSGLPVGCPHGACLSAARR